MDGWDKLKFLLLGSIAAMSVELMIAWVLGISELWVRTAGIVVACVGAFAAEHSVAVARRKKWNPTALAMAVQLTASPAAANFRPAAIVASLVLFLPTAIFLWRHEIYAAVMRFFSKHSDRARRQHLRNVLKDIDRNVATQRETRTRVAAELERLEPKPTYRQAAPPDDLVRESEGEEEREKPWTTNGEDIYP